MCVSAHWRIYMLVYQCAKVYVCTCVCVLLLPTLPQEEKQGSPVFPPMQPGEEALPVGTEPGANQSGSVESRWAMSHLPCLGATSRSLEVSVQDLGGFLLLHRCGSIAPQQTYHRRPGECPAPRFISQGPWHPHFGGKRKINCVVGVPNKGKVTEWQ